MGFIAEGGTRRYFAPDVPVILDTGDPVAANRSPTLGLETRKACCLSMRIELPAPLPPTDQACKPLRRPIARRP